jgi:hypothetical protein
MVFMLGSLGVLYTAMALCMNKFAPHLRHLVHDASMLNMFAMLAISLLCGFVISVIWSIYCARIAMWIWTRDRGWLKHGRASEPIGA